MKFKFITSIALASLLMLSCQNKSTNASTESNDSSSTEVEALPLTPAQIAYTTAENYFVNNDVDSVANPKIETAEQFNNIFGMATTMGEEGKPTEIDFDKQYVIAVVLPETDQSTTIEPVSLQHNEESKIVFTYKTIVGEKQSNTSRPFIAIIVDKSVEGEVVLSHIEE